MSKSMSGIIVDDSVKTVFTEMNLKKTHRYAIFRIENKERVYVEKLGEKSDSLGPEVWEKFMDDMLPYSCAYALFDFNFLAKDGRKIQKLAFIFMCLDESAKIGEKMIYSSTKDAVKRTLGEINLVFQINDMGDMNYNDLKNEVERKAKI